MDLNSCLTKLITSFIDYDYDYDKIQAGFMSNDTDYNPEVGLIEASIGGHIDIINIMIEKGARILNIAAINMAKHGHFSIIAYIDDEKRYTEYLERWNSYKEFLKNDLGKKMRNALTQSIGRGHDFFILSTGKKDFIDAIPPDELIPNSGAIEAALIGGYKPIIDRLMSKVTIKANELFSLAMSRNDLAEITRLLPFTTRDRLYDVFTFGSYSVVEAVIFTEYIGSDHRAIMHRLIRRNMYKLIVKYDNVYGEKLRINYHRFSKHAERLKFKKIHNYFYNKLNLFWKLLYKLNCELDMDYP